MAEPILQVKGLGVRYGGKRVLWHKEQAFDAAIDVDLAVAAGEALAIVGESGAGKSTVARCVAGLLTPTTGTVEYQGKALARRRSGADRRAIQMVFQDPYSSLNPRMKVGTALTELLRVNGIVPDRDGAITRARELMEMVGMPHGALDLRPNAFSGGQRQRIGISRALALEPRLLVADEPVSALDVSIQASILLLLRSLQTELGLTLLFISHDLAVVHQLCDRVAVMRGGRVIEQGAVEDVFADPQHEFTRRLLEAATDLPPLEISESLSAMAARAQP